MNYDYSFGLLDITNDIQTLSFNESLTNKDSYSNHHYFVMERQKCGFKHLLETNI